MKESREDIQTEEERGWVMDLFNVSLKIADKVIGGESFYNPLTNRIQSKASLLKGNYDGRADRIRKWIDREEQRISNFPGYDGIEPFIHYAQDTENMILAHSRREILRKADEIRSRESGQSQNPQGTVMEEKLASQFTEMKRKHPDAILLFRIGDTYQTYREDADKACSILGIDKRDIKTVHGETVANASFPDKALDTYLPKLVRAGLRVAICEQLEDPKRKKKEKEGVETSEPNNEPTHKEKDMPKKKKEKAPQEEPAKTVRASSDGETPKEKKAESQSATQGEAAAERKPREPQMVTVNGDKVTHGHAYQSNVNPQDWYFTARINGEQLKPQKMDPADVIAYEKKEITVPELMQRYYPTKLMPRVPEEAFKYPNGLAGPSGPITIDKFNVYKETDETRADYGRYKFYAQVGDKKMSTPASREDLNAYFDRVMTPGQLVECNFGERLHLPSHYAQFRLPEGIDPKGVRVAKDRSDGRWRVSADLGEGRGRTSKQEISFDDGYSLFKAKSATREQIAAKYLGQEIAAKLAAPLSMEKSASMKV